MAETAVLRVLGDILLALHREEFAALTVLDLPAAFNAVDHATLLIRLYIYPDVLVWYSLVAGHGPRPHLYANDTQDTLSQRVELN